MQRETLTVLLSSPEDKDLKRQLQRALIEGQADGRYPAEMTLSQLITARLRAGLAAEGAAK